MIIYIIILFVFVFLFMLYFIMKSLDIFCFEFCFWFVFEGLYEILVDFEVGLFIIVNVLLVVNGIFSIKLILNKLLFYKYFLFLINEKRFYLIC